MILKQKKNQCLLCIQICRYFRFYGRIAIDPDNHDEQTINAIKQNVQGLEIISGERIWSEWHKILDGNFHRELTKKIIECGCAKYMGLPENLNLEHFDEVCLTAQKNKIKLRPISKAVALLNTDQDVMELFKRLKFPGFDRNLAVFIALHREDKLGENLLKQYQRLVLKTIGKVSDMREFVCELLKYKGALDLLEEFNQWDSSFPINGRMITEYLPPNKNKVIGDVLSKLKDIWLDSDCQMPTEKLQTYIPKIVAETLVEFEEKMEKLREARESKKAASKKR